MATLASLMVKLDGDASGLHRTFGDVERRAGRTGSIIQTAMGTALGFVGAQVVMRGFAAATSFAGDALIGYNARMEQASIGFTTLLGSAEKATSFIEDLKDFAAKTPFDFPGLQSSANMMLAMGFNADEILPALTSVGDAVAALGLGSEAVGRATYALGQMRSAGRVNAQDMMQLTSMGIPAWQMLADAMGKTVPEVRKLSEQGLIPAKVGLDAILNGIRDGNMGGMMAAQANTFNGAMSTIKDILMDTISGALTPLFLRVRDVAVGFSQWLQGPDAAAWGERLSAVINRLNAGIGTLVELGGKAVTFVTGLTGGFSGLNLQLGPVGAAIQDVLQALGYIWEVILSGEDVLAGLGETFDNLLEKMAALRGAILDALGNAFQQLVPMVTSAIDTLGTELPKVLNAVLPHIIEWISTAASQFMAFGTKIADTIAANAPAMVAAISKFAQAGFDWLINEGVPKAAAAIGPLALKFIDWVFETLPKLLGALDVIIGGIIDFIIRNAPVLAGKLIEWALAFVGFIATEVVPRLIANLPTILRTVLVFIGGFGTTVITRMGGVGANLVTRFIGFVLTLPGKLGGVLATALSRLISWAGTMIGRAASTGTSFVARFINFVITLPGRLANALASAFGRVVSWAGQMASKAASTASGFVQSFITNVLNLPSRVTTVLGNIISGVVSFGSRLFSGAVSAGKNFVTGIMQHIGSLPGKLWDAIVGAFKRLFPIRLGPIVIGLTGVSVDMPEIKLFQTGTLDTGSGLTPAILHPHEMVLPAPVAEFFRKTGGVAGVPVMAGGGFAGGGVVNVNVHIDEFYGTEQNVSRLGTGIARDVRRERLRGGMG